jgi:hypothetical protein
MPDATYTIHGGSNFALPEPGAEGESFATLAEALDEWLRRRNDWTGRYPGWGDGDVAVGYIIVLGTEVDTFEGWSLVQAFIATGRDLDELGHYVEPADIACEAIAPPGSSYHQRVIWALRALEGYDAPTPLPGFPAEPSLRATNELAGRAIRRDFPELERLVWDGPDLDLDAMDVDLDRVEALAQAIEDLGEVEWIDDEPHRVGVDVLREQLERSAS